MKAPRVIAERFDVEGVAGAGGMARVFVARDRATGEKVAVKLLFDQQGSNVLRFEREASVLAVLQHPAIVRHVAHGITSDGEKWLAMAWLDGETLDSRLTR